MARTGSSRRARTQGWRASRSSRRACRGRLRSRRRGHHATPRRSGVTPKFWLKKHVLGEDVVWPEHPKWRSVWMPTACRTRHHSGLTRHRAQGGDVLRATNPCSYARCLARHSSVRQGTQWIGKMPVIVNVDDYVFGYANITYEHDDRALRPTSTPRPRQARQGGGHRPSHRAIFSDAAGFTQCLEPTSRSWKAPEACKDFAPRTTDAVPSTEQVARSQMAGPGQARRLCFKFYCTEPGNA